MSILALKEKFNSLTLESENHWDYRGNNNSERDYVHGFCTYPAMMVPKMQREMLDVCLEHLQDTSIRLLDPFAGSGTILVEGMLRGLNIVGIDVNPLAIDIKEAGMTDGAILWLLDRNFSRVGESEEAGLKFAENILSRKNASQNYIYILSAVEPNAELTEDDIEEEFDKVLAAHCSPDTHSFIYYISKRRLQTKNNTKIAKSLSQGFKRKACFELFQLFNSCLSDGVSAASTRVQRIRQRTLNYLFTNKASVRGEPYIEVAARLVQIFHQDEYNRAIAGQHSLIAEKVHYYEKLCSTIAETVGNEQALTSTLKEYRDIELYNKHVNAQHCEIATGDIFKIGPSYFLLVSQSCDTCLRSDGHRKLEFASLLEIQDNKQTKFSYPLSCFLDMQKPVVIYHALKSIPFDILDLCVFNATGQASVVLNDIASFDKDLEMYTKFVVSATVSASLMNHVAITLANNSNTTIQPTAKSNPHILAQLMVFCIRL